MKKFILVAVLVGRPGGAVGGHGLRGRPGDPAAQGFGPGNGIHAPGTRPDHTWHGYAPAKSGMTGAGRLRGLDSRKRSRHCWA